MTPEDLIKKYGVTKMIEASNYWFDARGLSEKGENQIIKELLKQETPDYEFDELIHMAGMLASSLSHLE